MNVAELKKYLQERGVSVSGYLKTLLVEIASAVEKMVVPVDPNFEKDQTTDAEKLIIYEMLIPNPFSLKTSGGYITTLKRDFDTLKRLNPLLNDFMPLVSPTLHVFDIFCLILQAMSSTILKLFEGHNFGGASKVRSCK